MDIERVPDANWFEVSQIDENTWAISEPHHPQDSHFYLMRDVNAEGDEHALLIDTGLGVLPIRPLIEELVGVEPEVVLTHAHWDHIGGLREYPNYAVHEAEADLSHPALPQDDASMREYITDEDAALPEGLDLNSYTAFAGLAARSLCDGDEVRCGSRVLSVVHLPGHSPGSICLVEEGTGYAFCGDTIYAADIWAQFETCDLGEYRESVEKLASLKGVSALYPGHCEMGLPPAFAQAVANAFTQLDAEGKLCAGSGECEFDGFSIVL